MSRQRIRHLERQPTEEAIRLAVTSLVGEAGAVDVQRMSHNFQPDDVLVQVQLNQPLSGATLSNFRQEVAVTMRNSIPSGDPLEDWLVVIECNGAVLEKVAPYEKLEEGPDDWRAET